MLYEKIEEAAIEHYDDISDIYDVIYPDRFSETVFYVSYISTGRDLLEIGCGSGILSEQLYRHGYRVTGLDLSPDMLAKCKENCPSVDVHLGDMRDFDLGRQFDVVLVPACTLLHASTKEDIIRTLDRARTHCRETGRVIFMVDYFPEHHVKMWHGLRANCFFDAAADAVCGIHHVCEIDPETETLTQLFRVVSLEDQVVHRSYKLQSKLHHHSLLTSCIAEAGLEIESLFGNYDKAEFGTKGRSFIAVASPAA